MGKAIRLITFLATSFILSGLFFSCASTGAIEGRKIKQLDKYEHWLKEEIALLITDKEEKEFSTLVTGEEKENFIQLFWLKRDPSPGTKENEFREEWYRRLEAVARQFNRGQKKGWHSDMGKVYMFFGPPLQRRNVVPKKQPEDSGGGDMEPSAEIWVHQPYIIWTYQAMPDLGLLSTFRVKFIQYQHDFELDQQTPKEIQRALKIFPEIVIFNPDSSTLEQYQFSIDKESIEGKLIDKLQTAGEKVDQIPFSFRPIFSRASKGETYVSLLVQIEYNPLDSGRLEEITFFGKIKGEVERDFLSDVKVEKSRDNKLLAVFSLPSKPCKSLLYFGLKDKAREKYSLIKSELNIPDFWNGVLETSSPILSGEVRRYSGSGLEFSPYVLGEFKAAPHWDNTFKQNEVLNVLFYIYNPQQENNFIFLLVEYFIISSEVAYRLNPQEIKRTLEAEKEIISGTEIPLSPLKPGIYALRIKITDKNAIKFIEKIVEFKVLPSQMGFS